jgi:hypothetical protein
MGRVYGMMLALLAAFVAGWLMGADFPPPHTKDISIGGAFWLFLAAGGLVTGVMFSASGKRG